MQQQSTCRFWLLEQVGTMNACKLNRHYGTFCEEVLLLILILIILMYACTIYKATYRISDWSGPMQPLANVTQWGQYTVINHLILWQNCCRNYLSLFTLMAPTPVYNSSYIGLKQLLEGALPALGAALPAPDIFHWHLAHFFSIQQNFQAAIDPVRTECRNSQEAVAGKSLKGLRRYD